MILLDQQLWDSVPDGSHSLCPDSKQNSEQMNNGKNYNKSDNFYETRTGVDPGSC